MFPDALSDQVLIRIADQVDVPLVDLIRCRDVAYYKAEEANIPADLLDDFAVWLFVCLVTERFDTCGMLEFAGLRVAVSESARKVKKKELPVWWLKMSEKGRANYVAKRPNSKYADFVHIKTKKRVSGGNQSGDVDHENFDDEPAELESVEQDKGRSAQGGENDADASLGEAANPAATEEGEARSPDSPQGQDSEDDDSVDEPEQDSGKNSSDEKKEADHDPADDLPFTRRVVAKTRRAVKGIVEKEKKGASALKKFFSFKKLDDEEKEAAKKVAGHVAVALLGTLAAVALFSPLAPYASVLGDVFMDTWGKGVSGMSESAEDDSADIESEDEHDFAATLTTNMYEWLKADPGALLSELKSKYPELEKEKSDA